MKRPRRSTLVLGGISALGAVVAFAAPHFAEGAVFPRSAPIGQCRTVHGRMAMYNGTFSFRIWVIGTHRMLRVVDDQGDNFSELSKLPSSLAEALKPFQDDLFRPIVFADFKVCDFTQSRPGVMQSVTLANASHIRIEPTGA
jgi:hypothetical protein